MNLAIKAKGLSRTFKSYEKSEGLTASIKGFWNRKYTEKVALHPVDLEIESGKIVGLVGANGAGKTTLLKMLSGLIYPSAGSVEVLGFKPWERDNRYLKQMSILLGQKNQLWWDISPADSFNLLADIYDLDAKLAKFRVQELAELLDCKHVLSTQLRRLSLGERMKMEIIGSLLHSPRVLFLDEPTIGLDIVAQTTIRKFLDDYVRTQGPTVILTSHYMDDIAKLADRLLLISKGELVYQGTVQAFVNKTDPMQKLHFAITEPLLEDFQLNAELTMKTGQQEFEFSLPARDLPPVLAKVAAFANVKDIQIQETDFEDIIHEFFKKESRLLPPSGH
jgi:ABC-2 type transport system ATP-binding protein